MSFKINRYENVAAVEAKYSGLLREQTLAGFCKSAEDLVRTTEVVL
jgi:hypothetical protein